VIAPRSSCSVEECYSSPGCSRSSYQYEIHNSIVKIGSPGVGGGLCCFDNRSRALSRNVSQAEGLKSLANRQWKPIAIHSAVIRRLFAARAVCPSEQKILPKRHRPG
jgi:hypothetical protein